MSNDENDREEVDRLMAAEIELRQALGRLLKDGKANIREVKSRELWSDGCVCVRDPTEHLRRGLARLHQGHANEDTAKWVRRWVIAVLRLSAFAAVVAGITYGVYQIAE